MRLRTLQHMPCTGLSAPTVAALAEPRGSQPPRCAWAGARPRRARRRLPGTATTTARGGGPPSARATSSRRRSANASSSVTTRSLRFATCASVVSASPSSRRSSAPTSRGHRRRLRRPRHRAEPRGRKPRVFVRRATLAHELCHILFDPRSASTTSGSTATTSSTARGAGRRRRRAARQRLRRRGSSRRTGVRPAQTRPQRAARRGHPSLRHQLHRRPLPVWNGLARRVELTSLAAPNTRPDPGWEARKPLHGGLPPDPLARAAPVPRGPLQRADRGGPPWQTSCCAPRSSAASSWDTAAEWLDASVDEVRDALPAVRSLFPDVFVWFGRRRATRCSTSAPDAFAAWLADIATE